MVGTSAEKNWAAVCRHEALGQHLCIRLPVVGGDRKAKPLCEPGYDSAAGKDVEEGGSRSVNARGLESELDQGQELTFIPQVWDQLAEDEVTGVPGGMTTGRVLHAAPENHLIAGQEKTPVLKMRRFVCEARLQACSGMDAGAFGAVSPMREGLIMEVERSRYQR